MTRLRLAAAGAIAGAVTLLSSGAAQALYPDCGIALSLTSSTVTGGESFSFTADAGDGDCDWTVTYGGRTKTGSGTTISGTFDTAEVSKQKTSTIKAACTHELSAAPSATESTSTQVTPAFYATGSSATLQAATRTCPVSAIVTLLPVGAGPADADGVLPDTGGSNLWILVVGGALVAGGAGVTYAARRRGTSH
jgi:LPXTG-motif cell wall-anchored protein